MFTNFSQVQLFFNERGNFGIKPGLDRMKHLLKSCGHPEKKIDSVHVAGTNGKGSTIQYLKSALMKNDYHVGVFSSPSLEGITGHMAINDQQISESEFILILNELYPSILELDERKNHPTEFEIITVIAFMFFQRHAEIALIEAGMGGREDTTNCLDPLLSIITSIEFDHMQFLGETLEEIAYEKSGIIKKRRPVIIGDLSDRARNKIEEIAHNLDAPIYELGKQFSYHTTTDIKNNQPFEWLFNTIKHHVHIHQQGVYQMKNCSLALMAIHLLKKRGFHISMNKALEGIKVTTIPGRFEQINENPTIIVDGAHNTAGVKAFLQTVQMNYNHVHKTLVFAAFRDKDIESMLHELLPHFSKVIITTFDHPRAASVHELSAYMNQNNKNPQVMDEKEFNEWVNSIRSQKNHSYYFFTGSLSFIKIIKELFEIKRKL